MYNIVYLPVKEEISSNSSATLSEIAALLLCPGKEVNGPAGRMPHVHLQVTELAYGVLISWSRRPRSALGDLPPVGLGTDRSHPAWLTDLAARARRRRRSC